MTDVLLVYPRLTTVVDTAIRFPPSTPPDTNGDDILLIDGSSFILLINGYTLIETGH